MLVLVSKEGIFFKRHFVFYSFIILFPKWSRRVFNKILLIITNTNTLQIKNGCSSQVSFQVTFFFTNTFSYVYLKLYLLSIVIWIKKSVNLVVYSYHAVISKEKPSQKVFKPKYVLVVALLAFYESLVKVMSSWLSRTVIENIPAQHMAWAEFIFKWRRDANKLAIFFTNTARVRHFHTAPLETCS